MPKKSAKTTKPSPRVFQTVEDIYAFEHELRQSEIKTMNDEDKQWLQENATPVSTEQLEEMKARLEIVPNKEQLMFIPKENRFVTIESAQDRKAAIKELGAIPIQDYIEQNWVTPYKTGEASELDIPLEPIIFKKQGKTPPSVPYLHVRVTTSLAQDSELHHFLHTKARQVK